MSMPFRYKIKVLSQVAPPAPKKSEVLRGPLIAVEGDNAVAVAELGSWLSAELRKGDNLAVRLVDGPDVDAASTRKPMVQYHLLASEWLAKSEGVTDSMYYKPASQTPVDAAMQDVSPIRAPTQPNRILDENYDDSDESMRGSDVIVARSDTPDDAHSTPLTTATQLPSPETEKSSRSSRPDAHAVLGTLKPVNIISNFSLHASNVFACRIPIGPQDRYSPNDHWQWTATQWRGILGPDLTIFVRDATVDDGEKPTVLEEGNLFVVQRTKNEEGVSQLEAPALRRLGFEVSEWVRAFGV